MNIAFFVSSVGDTDLALKTINAIEQYSCDHQTIVIPLTKAAQERSTNFSSNSLKKIIHATDILATLLKPNLDKQQIQSIQSFIKEHDIDYVFIGVPSISSNAPFQIANALDIPVLIANEFMFQPPEEHALWNYLSDLAAKPTMRMAIPLESAQNDYKIFNDRTTITGHLSIDNAFTTAARDPKSSEKIKNELGILPEQKLVFMSSTTQPLATDTSFLDCLLSELKNHPTMQIRLGLHPGIQDLDAYLTEILKTYARYPAIRRQFQIILPETIISKIKLPCASISNVEFAHVFLKVNLNGADAAFAADKVCQAVPGALLNEALLNGKSTYSHSGKPYLKPKLFADNLNSFFQSNGHTPCSKSDLGLDDRTTVQRYAELILGS